ncbi:MAG: FHA domain-containing serine/threonine-protein kinase [Planctomycetota bacterium]
MPKIVVEKGSGRGDTFRITKDEELHIGRDTSSDIVLTDTLVSRRHLSIEGRHGGFFVRDADSLNGLYVNGERVAEARLRPGDKIQAGGCLLSFLDDDERRMSGGLIGWEVAGHRIVERLGRGGMGTVYKAVQLSLERPVAIKFLASEFVRDPEFIDRFVTEARAAGHLNHRNIVEVFDTGRWEGLCYYTMEYMPFGNIRDQIAGGQKLPLVNALPMMIDVAQALLYAEKKGIVHRDIKPDNLMIGYDGVVKVGDLGIAKALHDAPAVAQADGVYGSAHFMAPEQALGRDIDCRVDIYAMGATFYRVLTGNVLFRGESQKEILLKQINEKPTPIRELEPSVPKELAHVIERMLEKSPDKRYRSAGDFCGILEALAKSVRAKKP